MKIIQMGVFIASLSVMLACGNNTNKEADADNMKNDSDTISTVAATDSLKLKVGSYTNKELGYSINYPADILTLQENSDNTTDCVFLPQEGKAKLIIYKDERKNKDGSAITFNEAFEQDRESKKDRQISYNSLNPLFYIISGVEGNEIFYQKTIMANNTLVTAKLTYTKEEKPTYDAMIAPLFNSFK